jgi:hypothetical protein
LEMCLTQHIWTLLKNLTGMSKLKNRIWHNYALWISSSFHKGIFSISFFFDEGRLIQCKKPIDYWDQAQNIILLWLCDEHYKPIFKVY